MTAGEAGVVAAGCEAQRLVLTHISDELDPEWAIAEAQRAYDGPGRGRARGRRLRRVIARVAGRPVGTLRRHGP